MKNAVEYYLVLGLFRAARLLPYRAATRIGGALGSFLYRVVRLRRSITLDNLRSAFPEKPEREIQAIALGAYRNYGKAMLQALWSSGADEEEIVAKLRISDISPIRRALAEGNGLLLLSGHYGGWEFFASALPLRVGLPFVLVAQTQRNRRVGALVDSIRARFGNELVPMGIGTRGVIKALREKKVVGMLADQSGPREAVFVDFFGRPAATHRGAAALALKNRVPIVLLVIVRKPDETYETMCEYLDYSDLQEYSEENIRELTQRHVAILERYIRMHPDHWLWLHKRWKHTAFYEARQARLSSGQPQELPA
jgi:KDO2-lipid IV(A) lauroyltransferase